MKSQSRAELSFLSLNDTRDELLFKHFEQLSGINFNFEKFNQLLAVEVQSEDEMFANMASTQDMVKIQTKLNEMYVQADLMVE